MRGEEATYVPQGIVVMLEDGCMFGDVMVS